MTSQNHERWFPVKKIGDDSFNRNNKIGNITDVALTCYIFFCKTACCKTLDLSSLMTLCTNTTYFKSSRYLHIFMTVALKGQTE